MDEIDLKISMLLMANSRTPYKQLADVFHISVNSIHKRVKSLVELGIIKNFKARLGFANFSNISNIVMFGIPTIKDKILLLEELGKNEFIYNISRASGNLFYIYAYIRNISDLDSLVPFIRKTGKISELTVGIDRSLPPMLIKDKKKLTNLDYLIVNSLKDNSRKTISDIAEEVGVSTKTIKRRLDNLVENYLVEFYLDWFPTLIFTNIILKLKADSLMDDRDFIKNLKKTYGSRIVYLWTFSNLPHVKLICVWTESMKELQNIESSLLSENFDSVEITILIEGNNFPTWRETHLKEKIQEINLL
ncbi:MAG: winged helix-turn-helix transcriptional regulator [Promethearchaeota archaeon]